MPRAVVSRKMARIPQGDRDVIGSALEAIREGRLSVEDALRAAARGSERSRLALARLAKAPGPARRPTVRTFVSPSPKTIARAVASIRRRLDGVEGVKSVHWGVRRIRGRATGEPSVVVFVDEKMSPERLRDTNRRPLPGTVVVRNAGVASRITVDVQPVGTPGHLQAFAFIRVGTHVAIGTAKKPLGSLGGVVELADGTFGAITAGHVVQMAKGADLQAATATTETPIGQPLTGANGRPMVIVDETADIAIVGPIEGDIGNIAGEALFVRDPTHADLNHRVWVKVLRDFAPVAAYVDGIDVRTSFFRADGPGELTIDGLVAIDAVTQGGDSGAPVLDEVDNVIGFVVGSDNLRTYIMPAKRGLDALENSGN